MTSPAPRRRFAWRSRQGPGRLRSAYIRSLLGDFEAIRGNYGAAGSRTARRSRSIRVRRRAQRPRPSASGTRRARARDRCAALTARQPALARRLDRGQIEQAAGRLGAARSHYAQALAIEQRLAQGAGTDAGITLNEAKHGDPERAVRLGARLGVAHSVSSADAYSWALYRAGRIAAASRLSAEAMRLGSRDGFPLSRRDDRERAATIRAGKAAGTAARAEPALQSLYAPRARQALGELR